MHDLQQLVMPAQLTGMLGQSTPGEEVVLFNQIPDGNGGQALPADRLFGEAVAGTPFTPSQPVETDTLQSGRSIVVDG
ncbi:hypothetical protein [Hymenobacter jeollabukensis]|uniref:hypothetical protein n=1 Tax=Hymenobacter jeollabukensis TaxID=2025313 RepID=UPI001FE9E33A|nr:hypothetical protein [Hymenobacter jeollabukensis]